MPSSLGLAFNSRLSRFWWVFLVTLGVSCQMEPGAIKAPQEEGVYLFFRGTRSKEGVVSQAYYLKHEYISHVALGYWQDGDWVLYHVVNSAQKNDLKKTDFSSFYAPQDLTFAAFGKLRSEIDQVQLQRKIESDFLAGVAFDLQFNLENESTRMYCSEFLVHLLESTHPQFFHYAPIRKKLSGWHAKFLKRDSLDYYPADLLYYDRENVEIVKAIEL
ncbi:hypothetical protein [Croceiramulus getboli]|nr:hypothetical protein P8624_11645 [Flavobacteriaceae bacterium YJPT1-3]